MVLSELEKHYCINCGEIATQEHHVIPLSIGGNDIPSNKVWLCDRCHGKLHGIMMVDGHLSHSELVKNGIKKAKEHGSIPGKRPFKITKDFIDAYNLYKEKKISALETARRSHCGSTTFYKYVNMIKSGEIII